jgi:hypothetical protein
VAILPELVGKFFTTEKTSGFKAVEHIDKQCNSDIRDSFEKLFM